MKKRALNRLLIFLATGAFIIIGTILMIRYAKGYRPTMQGTVKGTGLLAANSFPPGAELYINDRLRSATDTTLNLDPGVYDIKIQKDGYYTWIKKLTIEEELVTQTNATLFPVTPTLQPLTYTGAINPIPAPDGSALVFAVASASASTKNGLYVQDLSSGTLSFNRSARQISRGSDNFDYTKASYTWSPSGSQILVSFNPKSNILLDSSRFNDLATLKDVSSELPTIFQEWEQELARAEKTRFTKLPPYFQDMLTDSTDASASAKIANLYLSPDGDKLLYQAKDSFTLPIDLLPNLPSESTQAEDRNLEKGNWYTYDLKEDKNFFLASSPESEDEEDKILIEKLPLLENVLSEMTTKSADTPAELGGASSSAYRQLSQGRSTRETISLLNAQYAPISITSAQWYSDSYHLVLSSDAGIAIVEYDRGNYTTVYAGPFDHSFVYPWPDGSRIITLIQFSPDTIPNLYTIKLK